MILNKIMLSTALITPMTMVPVLDSSVKEEYEIILTNESSFHPTVKYFDQTQKTLYGVVADNDSAYNDGGTKYHSFYNGGNGEFVFALPENYSSVSINTNIKVSGVYDQYYSVVEGVVPIGADVVNASQEIFHLEGTVTPSDTLGVTIGTGRVTTILDSWFHDDYGYADVTWKMKLNEYGNTLTIWCEGYETGDIWGAASPIWAINEFNEASETEVEYHNRQSDSTWWGHHNFQNPENYSDNSLHITVTKYLA